MKINAKALCWGARASVCSVLLVACVSGPRGGRDVAGRKTSKPTFEQAGARVQALLVPRILTLDRSVLTFHYEFDDFNLKTQAEVAAHVGDWTENFFNPSKVGGGEAGPGVSVASDPFSSRDLSTGTRLEA